MSNKYDMIVIGSGPAGENAAELASYFGYRVAIIERNKPGGTPTTHGGAPTKTLREAALALTGIYDQEVYGVELGAPPAVALDKLAERTRQVCQSLQAATAQRIALMDVAYLHGTARLAPGGTVLLTEMDGAVVELSARVILIATGSRPLRPKNIPFDDPAVFDVDELYGLTALPESLVIVGGGAVGVEFATIFNALGATVTLTQASDRLAPMMDGELSQMMAQIFEARGVRVLLGAETDVVTHVGNQLHVTLSNGATYDAEAVFFATGRRPNTEDLGLGDVGVAVDERGFIVVDRNFQTSVPGVYAAGDVLGPGLSSVAMEQGRVAACRAFGIDFLEMVDPIPISAVYGMPEMAGVGLTEEQCQEQGIDYAVGRATFASIPRGAISGHDGLLKLIFRQDDRRLLGVHCFGEIASELIGAGQMVLHYGGTIDIFSTITLPTPTYSYAYKNATFDALRQVMTHPKSIYSRSNATMKAIKSTWKTLTDSLGVVGQYSSYSVYPLLSFIIMLLVTFTGIIPLFERVLGSDQNDMLSRVLFFLVVYLAYGVLYFVITFCNVALLTGIAARLDGENPGLAVGIVRASQRIGLIVIYTLVSATLGLLSVLARVLVNPLFGMLIAPLIGNRLWVHWRQLSYSIPLLMAVPVIAFDRSVPEHVFKRGGRLVKETWGERVKPAHSIGLLALLVLLPILGLLAMPILRQGGAEHNADLLRLGLSVMLIAISTYTQISALVNAIFALAAYRYATAQKSDIFPGDPSYAEHAFVKPKKATDPGAALTASTSDSPSVIANDSSN